MTRDQILIMKTRLCSIPPRKMQDIRACSEAAYKILADLPELLDSLEARQERLASLITPPKNDENPNNSAM